MDVIELLKRRRDLMNVGLKGLPYDAELDYLESRGGPVVDTGIIPTSSTGIKITLAMVGMMTIRALAGCKNSNWKMMYRTAYYNFIYGDTDLQTSSVAPAVYDKTVDSFNFLNDGIFHVERSGLEDSIEISGTVSPIDTIKLFGINDRYYVGKVSNVQISEGGLIIMDLIPVRVGNVGYFYDKIRRRLFGANSGSFVLGCEKDGVDYSSTDGWTFGYRWNQRGLAANADCVVTKYFDVNAGDSLIYNLGSNDLNIGIWYKTTDDVEHYYGFANRSRQDNTFTVPSNTKQVSFSLKTANIDIAYIENRTQLKNIYKGVKAL